jgi:hypothetical protein
VSGPCLSSSVAGRPLRPATRRRLGEPLPHQLADRPRAIPQTAGLSIPTFHHQKKPPSDLMRYYSEFPRAIPLLRVCYPRVTHPFATKLLSYCYSSNPVRLACLIHAASVRSEPESNSPKSASYLSIQGLLCKIF